MLVNNKPNKQYFSQKIVEWHKKHNKRPMPWKGEKDPYKIWLSEIILQQTRVLQGLAYYNRFVTKYPTVMHLAKAKDEEVYKLWEGLGYYSRCKNLLATARIITENGGMFPQKYNDVLALKGVGTYTAAANVTYAYNQPDAVVDGNVNRILARCFGITIAIDSTKGKKTIATLANELLDKKQPGKFNQAMMDFGATICKPRQPLCNECILQANCFAFKHNQTSLLPKKEKKITIKKRWMHYLLAEYKNSWLIRKRDAKDIWQNLYEFILIETSDNLSKKQFLAHKQIKKFTEENFSLLHLSKEISQRLTHQQISGRLMHIRLTKKISPEGYEWVLKEDIKNKAFTGFINKYLKKIKKL